MKRCGLKMIRNKLRQKRLQWFGHVRRETERGLLSLVEKMEVLEKRKVGRPWKTWKDIVKRDLELIGVKECVALDQGRWRKIIASPTVTERENMDFKRYDDDINNNNNNKNDDFYSAVTWRKAITRALTYATR